MKADEYKVGQSYPSNVWYPRKPGLKSPETWMRVPSVEVSMLPAEYATYSMAGPEQIRVFWVTATVISDLDSAEEFGHPYLVHSLAQP